MNNRVNNYGRQGHVTLFFIRGGAVMRITIAGGGNIGTQFAVHTAEKGHEVTIFTSNPGLFRERLSIVDKSGNTIHEGNIHLATRDTGNLQGTAGIRA